MAWSRKVALGALALALFACDDDPAPSDPASASVGSTGSSASTGVGASGGGGNGGASGGSGGDGATGGVPLGDDKVDLLLVVDNSRSMAAKQALLAEAVPDLVGAFVNPPCVDAGGAVVAQPASPTEACASGTRAFAPVTDMHLGIISSSLGGHGADVCPDSVASSVCGGAAQTTNNDHGHLVYRTDPCTGASAPTYDDLGFLAWDPAGVLSPPGDASLASVTSTFAEMLRGVGAIGCGFEAPLEAMYRFLADPAPYQTIAVEDGSAVKQGVDAELLAERAAFLRPDSLLAVLVLSDENDCSFREGGSFFLAAQVGQQFHLPPARQECATDPADPCCASCGQATPSGCPADPTCDEPLDNLGDPPNLRCFDQKRRFGIDFLYPTQRYVNALTLATISPDSPDLEGGSPTPNPIFSDLGNSGARVRGPEMVFMAGIVGVPWQLVAKDPTDIAAGYLASTEIDWDVVVGDPATYAPPLDPHMVESIAARPGIAAGDPINGGERTITGLDNLQYACTFDLPDPLDCTLSNNISLSCECTEANTDNPVCSGPNKQTQVKEKAYPGLRTLSVLRGMGERGVVGSICPAVQDPTQPTHGYRPAVRALLDAVRPALTP